MGTTAPRPVRLKSSSINSSDTSAKYSWPMTLQKLAIQDSSSSMLADEMLDTSEIDSESSSSSSSSSSSLSSSAEPGRVEAAAALSWWSFEVGRAGAEGWWGR